MVGRRRAGRAILFASLAFNLLGDGLRDKMDPSSGTDNTLLTVERLAIGVPEPQPVALVKNISFSMERSGWRWSVSPVPASR